MELFICHSVTSTINLLTNLRFLPDMIVLDLKELGSAAPFQNKWQWSREAELVSTAFLWPHTHPLIFISVLNHFGVDKAQEWVGPLWYSCHILLHKVHCGQGPFLFLPPIVSLSLFPLSFLTLSYQGRQKQTATWIKRWSGGSCLEPITIQNGFSQTEKNSCLHYLNASPYPAPLIGSLITGRGAQWLIRNRVLVK